MIWARKALAHLASQLTTAGYDHRESAGQNRVESLDRPAKMFSLATILQVPVGYQDDLGFHCGQPQVEATGLGSLTDQHNQRATITSF